MGRVLFGLLVLELIAFVASYATEAWSCGPSEGSTCSLLAQISLPATLLVIPALILIALIVAVVQALTRSRRFR